MVGSGPLAVDDLADFGFDHVDDPVESRIDPSKASSIRSRIRPDMQETRALGRHHPFVAIVCMEIGPQSVQVQQDMPGLWASSITDQMPRARASATIRSMGKTSAVAEVIWLRNTTRARSVSHA
ncbi:hypothetical protein [Tabrizicola thermarum]|uniref:hypothetical protein n=1 Tax=Tabrizicola thermarum TaxID=2670345 RepID=UPI001EE44D74|nr:hypothetical protein [Tabrizicola thermarum]